MADVFINYRTGDGDKTAMMIERELSHRFGEDRVYRAGKSIKPGQRFGDELITNVRRSSVLVAVIGPNWARSPALHDEDDWVRKEILEAFAYGLSVIPVLDGRATERLRGADLPVELARLADLQSLPLSQHTVGADLTRLGDMLAELVPALREVDRARPRSPEPPATGDSVAKESGTTMPSALAFGGASTVAGSGHGPALSGKFTGDVGVYHDSQHFSGDGATYVAGDNQGGVRHRFSASDGPDGDET